MEKSPSIIGAASSVSATRRQVRAGAVLVALSTLMLLSVVVMHGLGLPGAHHSGSSLGAMPLGVEMAHGSLGALPEVPDEGRRHHGTNPSRGPQVMAICAFAMVDSTPTVHRPLNSAACIGARTMPEPDRLLDGPEPPVPREF